METQMAELLEQAQLAGKVIEVMDENVTNKLVNSKHASKEFKDWQRISNVILNVIRAIDALKYEL